MKKLILVPLAAAMLCSTAYAQNLIAHYALDEAPGATTAADSATLGAQAATPGTINGTITLGVPGVLGTAYDFTDGFIELQADGTAASDVNPSGPFTLTMWAKPTAATPQNTALYTTQNNIAAAGAGWVFKTQSPGWRVFLDTADADTFVSSWLWNLDQWQMLWLRYDGNTVQAGSIPLGFATITGDDIAVKGQNEAVGGAIDLTPAPVRIGAIAAATAAYVGSLDDVRMYDDSLTTTQLAIIFNEGVPEMPAGAQSEWMLLN